MARKIFDSWALMAWIMGESAAAKVDALLNRAAAGQLKLAMSLVNVGEVFYCLAKRGRRELAEDLLRQLPFMPIKALVPSGALILDAARLKSWFPISYADAFAVATARQQSASLITGDPELRIFGGPFTRQQAERARPADLALTTGTVSPAGIVAIDWIGD